MDLGAKKNGRNKFSRGKCRWSNVEVCKVFTQHIATLRSVHQAISIPYHNLYNSLLQHISNRNPDIQALNKPNHRLLIFWYHYPFVLVNRHIYW